MSTPPTPPPPPPKPRQANTAVVKPNNVVITLKNNNSNRAPNNTGKKYNKVSISLYKRLVDLINKLRSSNNNNNANSANEAMKAARDEVKAIAEVIAATRKEFVDQVNKMSSEANKRINRNNLNLKFKKYTTCSDDCPKIRDMDGVIDELGKFLNAQVKLVNKANTNATNALARDKNMMAKRKQMKNNKNTLIRELEAIRQKI